MEAWREKARKAVIAAAYSPDPNAIPEYLVPKPKPWWAFWRKQEWETVRGVSRAQMVPFQEAVEADLRARARRLRELYPDASPFTNLYAPWLDAPAQGIVTEGGDANAAPVSEAK